MEGDYGLRYRGVDTHTWAHAEVACLIHKYYINEVKDWELINERIMGIKLKLNDKESLTVISVYVPNESDNTDVKEKFWTKLQEVVESNQRTLIIGEELNGRVGNDEIGSEKCIDRFGEQVLNANG